MDIKYSKLGFFRKEKALFSTLINTLTPEKTKRTSIRTSDSQSADKRWQWAITNSSEKQNANRSVNNYPLLLSNWYKFEKKEEKSFSNIINDRKKTNTSTDIFVWNQRFRTFFYCMIEDYLRKNEIAYFLTKSCIFYSVFVKFKHINMHKESQ